MNNHGEINLYKYDYFVLILLFFSLFIYLLFQGPTLTLFTYFFHLFLLVGS